LRFCAAKPRKDIESRDESAPAASQRAKALGIQPDANRYKSG